MTKSVIILHNMHPNIGYERILSLIRERIVGRERSVLRGAKYVDSFIANNQEELEWVNNLVVLLKHLNKS